ncbi:hypothetical protein HS7_02550 [Sulfolobales archaeon HS-7]|nr:hypothetical protein HS7_02550 [Sulfolobales archaeon HS-7]
MEQNSDEIEELIKKGLALPDSEVENYFKELYHKYSNNARVAYEYAGILDYLGREEEAIPLYKKSLEMGLEGRPRDMCLIQLGSSLRVTGRLQESEQVLREIYERTRDPASLLFLVLTLSDMRMSVNALCLMSEYILRGESGFLPEYKGVLSRYFNNLCIKS